jgi:hypothetical protein
LIGLGWERVSQIFNVFSIMPLILLKPFLAGEFKSFTSIEGGFLGDAPRAFKNRPGSNSPLLSPPNMFPMNNSILKSRQQRAHHFLKPARANFAGFEKLSANSKAILVRNG